MRLLCLIGLAPNPWSALERRVTYAYYAESPLGDIFPRQVGVCARAQEEGARYGFVAVPDWDNITTYPRIRSATCDRAGRRLTMGKFSMGGGVL
jgi:hypothetical protein